MFNFEPFKCIMRRSTCFRKSYSLDNIHGICFSTIFSGNSKLSEFVQPSWDDQNSKDIFKVLGKSTRMRDFNHKELHIGFNFWIGRNNNNEVGIVQTLPISMRGWGVGQGRNGSGNDGWIQVCICPHLEAEYGCSKSEYIQDVQGAMIVLSAYVCKLFDLDPEGTSFHSSGIEVPVVTTKKYLQGLGLAFEGYEASNWFLEGTSIDQIAQEAKLLLQ